MTLQQIESSISSLSSNELAELSDWFEEFVAEKNDVVFAQRVESGEFDALAKAAEASFAAGECRDL